MKYVVIFLSALVLMGCGATVPQPDPNAPPAWVHAIDTVGAVGSCGEHMKGRAAQEQVAINRALEILAKQQTVTISTNATDSQSESGGHYGSSHNSNTSVNATTQVKASIKGKWLDPRTKVLYVWMVLD